jgi:hypothetical protein
MSDMADAKDAPVVSHIRGKLKTGKDTAELTANDLFDKIINLAFYRRDDAIGTPYFVLRSDYEVVYDQKPPHGAHFTRIKQKPHIKITYEQVSPDKGIALKVEVANLYFHKATQSDATKQPLTENGGAITIIDSVKGNPIQWIVIQAGYRTQFPDWTKEPRATGSGYLDRFYDLDNNAIAYDQGMFKGQVLTGRVLECHNESYPPDQLTVFDCVVATMDNGLKWSHNASTFLTNFDKIEAPGKTSQLEKVLYHLITRRFLKTHIQTRIETQEGGKERLYIRNYNEWRKLYGKAAAAESSNGWSEATLTSDGLLSFEDADVFGVPCHVTARLAAFSMRTLASYTLKSLDELPKASESPPIQMENYLQAQVLELQRSYPGLRWYHLNDGGFFFYHARETMDELYREDARIKTAIGDAIALPAIYDISLDGLRMIRCPFIGFINPMTILQWNSRYALSTLVGYFYRPDEGTNYYTALLIKVTFDTDGDNNLMEIECVDAPASVIEARRKDGEDRDSGDLEYPVSVSGPELFDAVKRRVVCRPKPAPTESASVIIERYLRPSARANLAAWGGVMPTVERMAADFKAWNPEYFTEDYLRTTGLGDETLTYFRATHKTDFKCPWFYDGDLFWIYEPYLPGYGGLSVKTIEEPSDR